MGRGSRRASGASASMNRTNSQKAEPSPLDFQWTGTLARVRRAGGSARSGRRSALLGLLTSAYANSNRGTNARAADARPGPATDRS